MSCAKEMIMQERHINRKQYFEEQAATSRKYYLKETDYFVKLRSGIRVLEVGCPVYTYLSSRHKKTPHISPGRLRAQRVGF